MYHDYKKFLNQIFPEGFVRELSEKKCPGGSVWFITALNILNKQAPVKKKHIGDNQSAFVTKEIKKSYNNPFTFTKQVS